MKNRTVEEAWDDIAWFIKWMGRVTDRIQEREGIYDPLSYDDLLKATHDLAGSIMEARVRVEVYNNTRKA